MGTIHYEVVHADGSFKRYNTIDELKDIGDFFFIVEKEEGYHCATYSHYHARIIDEDGNPTHADYRGYIFRLFSIYGQAGDYVFSIRFDMPRGQGSKLREFHEDISYNHTYEAYSMVKPEWDYGTQYKDLFTYFDNLDKYGVDAYDRILELEREAYKQNALYRREQYDYSKYKDHISHVVTYVKELVIPESVTRITDENEPYLYDSIERLFLPSTLESICHFPFYGGKGIKQVFCMAEKPPQVFESFRSYDNETTLYVPREALQAYKENDVWAKVFIVMKGI